MKTKIYDQRNTSIGRPEKNFSEFYKELDALLEGWGKAIKEHCHSEAAHMPVAVSLINLFKKVYFDFILTIHINFLNNLYSWLAWSVIMKYLDVKANEIYTKHLLQV